MQHAVHDAFVDEQKVALFAMIDLRFHANDEDDLYHLKVPMPAIPFKANARAGISDFLTILNSAKLELNIAEIGINAWIRLI